MYLMRCAPVPLAVPDHSCPSSSSRFQVKGHAERAFVTWGEGFEASLISNTNLLRERRSINIGGGMHHASHDSGSGWCVPGPCVADQNLCMFRRASTGHLLL